MGTAAAIVSGQNLGGNKFNRFPGNDAAPQDILDYRDRHFAHYFTYRDRHMQRIVKNIYYDIGRQWVELNDAVLIDGARGYAFREMLSNSEVEYPRPVTNIIAPSIDVEFATLAKRQWIPKIPTYSPNPRIEASSKVAHEILLDRLDKLQWDTSRDSFIRNMITMGTATFHSFWDQSHFDVVWAAVSDPLECPSCGAVVADRKVPMGMMALRRDNPNATMTDLRDTDLNKDDMVGLNLCPQCAKSTLRPTNLTPETSQGQDIFGRDLGRMVPKGNTNLELLTPFEYYPHNAGIFQTPETMRQHGMCKVRSLDWIEEHWPEIIDNVQPEDPLDLLREHPLLGEWDIVGRFDNAGLDTGIFDNHCRVYELVAEPSHRYPKGRLIRIVGRDNPIIAENRALVVDLEDPNGKKIAHVPLVVFASARWKVREGEFWGKGLPDDLISVQNRINGIDSQTIDARERMGSPNLLVPDDSNLTGPESRSGYGTAKIFKYRVSLANPQSKPEVFGSILMPQGVNIERDQMMQDATRIIGPADIELGEAPRNVTTTSGLQILGEQAERRRGTRERGITTSFKRVWEHQLQMLWVLRDEPDEYAYQNPSGAWEVAEFTRDHIAGHTRVEVERQAYIDRSIMIRESTRQAITDGLVDIMDPLVRKKAIELMGLPNDLNEKSNVQIDQAKRVWVDFIDRGKVPVVDATLDDPFLNAQVLGTFLKQDEGRLRAEESGWPLLVPIIAGWQEELQRITLLDQKTRMQYGGEPPPEQANEMFARLQVEYAQAKDQYDLASSGRLGPLAKQATLQTPPPEPPLPPNFVPRQIEERIYLVWQKMIQNKVDMKQFYGVLARTQKDPDIVAFKVETFLRFRAVVEAYKLMAGPSAPAPGGVPPPGPPPGAAPGGQDGGPPVGSEPLPPKPPPTPPVPV